VDAPRPEVEGFDSTDWGWDGGSYGSLSGPAAADTLPAAPEAALEAEAGPATEGSGGGPPSRETGRGSADPPRRSGAGPAQELGRAEAFARPLVGSVRPGGRLSFYAAWDAPASRVSLVGEWAAAGRCGVSVRVDYEQAVPGLGAVRGVGVTEAPPAWSIALLVPRQHCGAASARWREARAPRADEIAVLAGLGGGERPVMVVIEGDRIWVAWSRRAAVARIRDGRAVETWSDTAEDGASVRLLGVWDGEGVWVSSETGGRVVRVWRVPA
jgi:hypothetical protein